MTVPGKADEYYDSFAEAKVYQHCEFLRMGAPFWGHTKEVTIWEPRETSFGQELVIVDSVGVTPALTQLVRAIKEKLS